MQLLSNLDQMYGLFRSQICVHFSSLIIVENPSLFSLILELCLPFLKLFRLASLSVAGRVGIVSHIGGSAYFGTGASIG